MGKRSRASLTRYRRTLIWLRRHTNRLRKAGWAVRRFFTLEARPEDIHLRREVEKLLDQKYGLDFMPHPQIEKILREALSGKGRARP